MNRTAMIQRLATEQFDLLVIGGGITGSGVGREAALRGLQVGLVEANDFAYATSSRSTKLIHGGLRYLKNFEFRLVRESVEERQRLLFMAPHLVKATPFLFPVYPGDPDPLWMLHIGLSLYDWFAGKTNPIPHKMYKPGPLVEREPCLHRDGLKGGAIYADSRTDDGRLTLEVVQSAVAHGAVAANYLAVTQFTRNAAGTITGATVKDQITGDSFKIAASRVMAAAGPWADAIRHLDDPNAPTLLRLTKGVHLVLPHERLPIQHAVVMRGRDARIMFAVPSGNCTYIGTTDTDHDGDPGDTSITRWDVEYIFAAAQRLFPEAHLTTEDVIAGWSGFRPLLKPQGDADPSATSRDYKLFHSPSGLVSVGGGKLTAFRHMASHLVDDLFPGTRGTQHLAASTAPLPGAVGTVPTPDTNRRLAAETEVSPAFVTLLAERYGSALSGVVEEVQAIADTAPETRWRRAQARYAVKAEMAMRLIDVVQRRTDLMLFTQGNGRPYLATLATEMGALLGWSTERREGEIAACLAAIARMCAWQQER